MGRARGLVVLVLLVSGFCSGLGLLGWVRRFVACRRRIGLVVEVVLRLILRRGLWCRSVGRMSRMGCSVLVKRQLRMDCYWLKREEVSLRIAGCLGPAAALSQMCRSLDSTVLVSSMSSLSSLL